MSLILYLVIAILVMQGLLTLLVIALLSDSPKAYRLLAKFEEYTHQQFDRLQEQRRSDKKLALAEKNALGDPYRIPPEGSYSVPNAIAPEEKIQLVVDHEGRVYVGGQEYTLKADADLVEEQLQNKCAALQEQLDRDKPPEWSPGEVCPYCLEGNIKSLGMSKKNQQRLVWTCDSCQAYWESPPHLSINGDTYNEMDYE